MLKKKKKQLNDQKVVHVFIPSGYVRITHILFFTQFLQLEQCHTHKLLLKFRLICTTVFCFFLLLLFSAIRFRGVVLCVEICCLLNLPVRNLENSGEMDVCGRCTCSFSPHSGSKKRTIFREQSMEKEERCRKFPAIFFSSFQPISGYLIIVLHFISSFQRVVLSAFFLAPVFPPTFCFFFLSSFCLIFVHIFVIFQYVKNTRVLLYNRNNFRMVREHWPVSLYRCEKIRHVP